MARMQKGRSALLLLEPACPESLQDEVRIFAQGGVHVAEENALLLEFDAVAVEHDLAVVLLVTPARYLRSASGMPSFS